MAALTSSPSGFSYAQAARGQKSTPTSQTPSSKVTSGTATPATGTFSELGQGGNWADDVEATSDDKTVESRKTPQEQAKPVQAKDLAVERTKSESRTPNGSSGVSSPDLTATSSTTTNADETSSVPNGASSSDTTWETKSQASEPAWIAERKERQSSAHNEDGSTQTGKGRRGKKEPKEPKEGKESKEPAQPETPPTPVKLQDAPPPAVNPWAKRMETKTKTVTPPPKPAAVAQVSNENQRPRADSRKKSSSVDIRTTGGEAKKANVDTPKRNEDVRGLDRPRSKQGTEDATAPARASAQREHHSLPNLVAAVPPPVKDEGSWPTPENAQEKERKEVSAAEKESKDGKDADDSTDAENSGGAKRHQKPTWKPIAVTPSIIWQTEEMNRPRGGERGGRGGSGRGRGGTRGGANGAKGGDRSNGRSNAVEADASGGAVSRGRSSTLDRESMPPPPKPNHKSSASTSRDGRKTRDHSSHERSNQAKPFASIADAADAGPEGDAALVSDTRRTKSPSKSEVTDEAQEVRIPEPIPRQTPTAAQTGDSREGSEYARENSVRRGPYEGKKESRSFDSYNTKEWNGAPRGGKRGGRGRGGSREFANGHQPNQPFTNGHSEFSPYGVPPSPSGYQTPRGGYTFSQQGRGSWSRNNPRSQSIPIDNVYGGGPRPYWGQHPPHIQTGYFPGAMYDYSGMPMTAMPYNPMLDHNYLIEMVGTQLEYYFSLDNLLKDMFLRKHMDSQGFVFIDVIANFNRVKQLTSDKDLIKACCLKSESIEIRVGEDGKERLRRHQGWEQFLLPKEQREPSAQTDGPTVLQQPEPPQLQQLFIPPMQFRGPPSAGLPGGQRRSYDSGYPVNGAVPPFAPFSPLAEVPPYGELANGEEMRGRTAKSPLRETNGSPNAQSLNGLAVSKDEQPDDFPDEQASTLTVVVKMQPTRPSNHHHAASRTFSNGSIDTRSIFNEIEKPAENNAQPTTNGEHVVNGDGGKEATPRIASPSHSRSPEKGPQQSEVSLYWVKDKDLPQNNIPDDSSLELYHHLRSKALGQRDQAATGACPYDLDVLYQFWSHFLIRNFNNRMYNEFKFFAHDDAQKRHSCVGLQNLVLFYAKALASSQSIRDSIVSDYVELVKTEPPILRGEAFKQLRKAWRNGALNLKNRKKLADILDEQMKASLES